jgi:tight adherence protein B
MRLKPRMPLVPLAAVLAGLVVLGGAAPAGAQDPTESGQIVRIDAADNQMEVVFQAIVPEGTVIYPDSVRVTLNDQELDRRTDPIEKATTPINRQALLVLDTSESMTAEKLGAARDAALAFLAAVPNDVRVGLITFANEAQLQVPPTRNRDAVQDAIRGIASSRGTALYDAIALAVNTLSTAGVGNVVLLSDGRDTAPQTTTTSFEQARSSLERSQLGLTALDFASSPADADVLAQLAEAGNGQLVRATEVDSLSAAFEQSARAIATQMLITAEIPPGTPAGDFSLLVEAQAGDVTLTDRVFGTLNADAVRGPTEPPPIVHVNIGDGVFASQTVLVAAAILLFLGLSIMLAYGLSGAAANRREAAIRRRLAHYSVSNVHVMEVAPAGFTSDEPAGGNRISTTRPGRRTGATTVLGDSGLARTAVSIAERVVASQDSQGRLAARLESAAIPLRAAEWLVLHAAAAVLPAIALLLISGGDLALALLGFLLGVFGPVVYLSFKRSGRRHRFDEQLPGTLQLLSGSLSAGYSLPQAVDTVARQASQPVATEFGRAIMESRLAVPIEDALQHVAERTGSQDFGWVVMAIRIQRRVGGNLAELLNTIAGTLRERERLRRQVRVLSAEGRLSAYILGVMPLLFAMYLFVARRDYLMKLFTEPLGIAMVFAAVLLLGIGIFWMRKIVDVEV